MQHTRRLTAMAAMLFAATDGALTPRRNHTPLAPTGRDALSEDEQKNKIKSAEAKRSRRAEKRRAK